MEDKIREYLKDSPDLINRYERNEAKFILNLPEDYETVRYSVNFSEELLKCFYIALAEADMTMDEWAGFIMKSIILSHRLDELIEERPELKSELEEFLGDKSDRS